MVNEKHLKEKNVGVIFIDALVNMGFNKMKEEYWINEEGKWFHWVYRYESAVKDEAGVTLLNLNRKISMIFPLVSCCSCVNNPSSS